MGRKDVKLQYSDYRSVIVFGDLDYDVIEINANSLSEALDMAEDRGLVPANNSAVASYYVSPGDSMSPSALKPVRVLEVRLQTVV